jgi:hypothetical protein
MSANIAESRRAEERVAQGMRQCIAVRMAYWTFMKWKLDPAKNKFSALGQAM